MDIELCCKLKCNNWKDLSTLYLDAGLGCKTEERLERVFNNSAYQSFIYQGSNLLAAARAFTDGGDCAIVCDVAVAKAKQSKGLGNKLMAHLMAQIPSHERIMLFCTPGLEPFYQAYGFGKMTTGMCIFKDQSEAISVGYIKP